MAALLTAAIILLACGKGVMDDTGDHSSNSVRKNSLPSPELPANAVTPGAGTGDAYPASVNGTRDSDAPFDFMMQAAQSGIAEVELSRVAQSNSSDPAVKSFAQMMVSDHTKANDELKTLAGNKGAALPTGPDGSHQTEVQRLKGLKGAEFDAEYIRMMVADHEKAVVLFQAQAQNGVDPELKAWAVQTLPKLQAHLQAATGLQSKKPQ